MSFIIPDPSIALKAQADKPGLAFQRKFIQISRECGTKPHLKALSSTKKTSMCDLSSDGTVMQT